MVADDLTVASCTYSGMQQALNIAEQDASRERYHFNTNKTKTNIINKVAAFIINKRIASNISKSIETRTSEKEAHLGIQCFQKNNNTVMVEERIKIARAAAYKLMGAGIHRYNNMGTDIVLQKYLTHVIPILLYGLDALVL